jgi:hypothetical protein
VEEEGAVADEAEAEVEAVAGEAEEAEEAVTATTEERLEMSMIDITPRQNMPNSIKTNGQNSEPFVWLEMRHQRKTTGLPRNSKRK